MNKITETILILTAIFGAGLMPVSFAFVQTDNLVVEFETTPLYNEANFLPGEEVSRWVKVTNNGGQTQRIAAEVINKNDPDNFASRMNLTIAEGAAVIFNKTLAEFFNQGETYLSSLASGAQTQYDLKITFNSGSGNNYQEKNLGFDILVGFQGTEGGLPLPLPGDGSSGGGGGGFLPLGLTILNEGSEYVGTSTATIIWLTNYGATSQVVYGTAPGVFNLNPSTGGGPTKYGYTFLKEGDDVYGLGKGVSHKVTLVGLLQGTTYYYRKVSYGSFAVGTEHTFTTLGAGIGETAKEEKEINEENPGEIPAAYESGENLSAGEGSVPSLTQGQESFAAETEAGEAGAVIEEIMQEQDESKTNFNYLLAAIGGLFNLKSFWLLLTLLIIALSVVLYLRKNASKKKSSGSTGVKVELK